MLSAPSPTAISGAIYVDQQLCARSRTPGWKQMSSFFPSGVAPISTRMHSVIFNASLQEEAVGLYVNASAAPIHHASACVRTRPELGRQPENRRGDRFGALAQQGRQYLLEIAARDAEQ